MPKGGGQSLAQRQRSPRTRNGECSPAVPSPLVCSTLLWWPQDADTRHGVEPLWSGGDWSVASLSSRRGIPGAGGCRGREQHMAWGVQASLCWGVRGWGPGWHDETLRRGQGQGRFVRTWARPCLNISNFSQKVGGKEGRAVPGEGQQSLRSPGRRTSGVPTTCPGTSHRQDWGALRPCLRATLCDVGAMGPLLFRWRAPWHSSLEAGGLSPQGHPAPGASKPGHTAHVGAARGLVGGLGRRQTERRTWQELVLWGLWE